jgi:predicted transglutaminase-like cysteine proteinase
MQSRHSASFGHRLLLGVLLLCGIVEVESAQARRYPPIFHSAEVFSPQIQQFPQWVDVIRRFQDGTGTCDTATCSSRGWASFVASLKGESLETQLKEVNRSINGRRYTLDIDNWDTSDYWETPFQFLKKGGDCEDFAIAKYMALKALGVRVDDMRLVVVKDLERRVGHAVLVVYVGDGAVLLDNQIADVLPSDTIRQYRPIFSINEIGWWLHVPVGQFQTEAASHKNPSSPFAILTKSVRSSR